jgi:hypothetical protein
MKQPVPIYNAGPEVKYVGSRMIPAGETAVFEPHELPPGYEQYRPQGAPAESAAKVPDAPVKSPLQDLSDADPKTIIDALSSLNLEQLKEIEDLEKARGKKSRRTVLEAIVRQRIDLAKQGEIDERVQKFRDSLAGFKQEDLQELLKDYPDGEPEKAVIQEELQKLDAASE